VRSEDWHILYECSHNLFESTKKILKIGQAAEGWSHSRFQFVIEAIAHAGNGQDEARMVG